jgi:hypothetical protein
MATNESEGFPDVTAARAALNEAEAAEGNVASRAEAPWWYHVGLAIAPALLFASVSLGDGFQVVGALAAVLSAGLVTFASQRSGISVNRNRIGRGARKYVVGYIALVIVLACVGMYLEMGAEIRWSMAVAGALLVVPGIYVSYANDVAVRREVRSGR